MSRLYALLWCVFYSFSLIVSAATAAVSNEENKKKKRRYSKRYFDILELQQVQGFSASISLSVVGWYGYTKTQWSGFDWKEHKSCFVVPASALELGMIK